MFVIRFSVGAGATILHCSRMFVANGQSNTGHITSGQDETRKKNTAMTMTTVAPPWLRNENWEHIHSASANSHSTFGECSIRVNAIIHELSFVFLVHHMLNDWPSWHEDSIYRVLFSYDEWYLVSSRVFARCMRRNGICAMQSTDSQIKGSRDELPLSHKPSAVVIHNIANEVQCQKWDYVLSFATVIVVWKCMVHVRHTVMLAHRSMRKIPTIMKTTQKIGKQKAEYELISVRCI